MILDSVTESLQLALQSQLVTESRSLAERVGWLQSVDRLGRREEAHSKISLTILDSASNSL